MNDDKEPCIEIEGVHVYENGTERMRDAKLRIPVKTFIKACQSAHRCYMGDGYQSCMFKEEGIKVVDQEH